MASNIFVWHSFHTPLRQQIVVRVVFRSFESCGLRLGLTSGNETENPVYQTFSSMSGCRSIETSEDVPKPVEKEVNGKTFKGLLLGSGLPDEMLYEILVDPEDFLQEVRLK